MRSSNADSNGERSCATAHAHRRCGAFPPLPSGCDRRALSVTHFGTAPEGGDDGRARRPRSAVSPAGHRLLLRRPRAPRWCSQQIGAGLLDQDDLYADNHAHCRPRVPAGPRRRTACSGRSTTGARRASRTTSSSSRSRPRTSSRGRSAGRSTTTRSRRWRWSTAGRTGSSCAATTRAQHRPARRQQLLDHARST